MKRSLQRSPLGFAGNNGEQMITCHQGGHGQRQRMSRDIVQRGEAAVIHLLRPAGFIQFNRFNKQRIGEIGYRRIIERNMPVLTDAKADDINRRFIQQLRVSPALPFNIARPAQQLDPSGIDSAEQPFLQIVPEALMGLLRQADIFIHMKSVHPGPVNPLLPDQSFIQLIL